MPMISSLPLALRLAGRELRGGVRGFRIFLACLALGVAAIAAVQSVSQAVSAGLAADGASILGGDVEIRQLYRPATPEQRSWLDASGRLSVTAEMRAMARTAAQERSVLVEFKAVDAVYPLFGSVVLEGGGTLAAALAAQDGVAGAVAEAPVLDRLGIGLGDILRVGDQNFELRGVIAREPDRVGSGGFSLGPRLMVGLDALAATGLERPGSLIYWSYRLALPAPDDTRSWKAALQARFPEAGWRLRDASEAAPQLTQLLRRLTLFLTLVGLTALLVGGVGVGNAVSAWLDRRTATIAILKCLGASGGLVVAASMAQLLALAGLAIALGLAAGAATPPLLAGLLGDLLPLPVRFGIFPQALALAAAFGLLTLSTFALWPLGRAREVPPGALFRDALSPVQAWPRRRYWLGTGLSACGLAGLAIASADDPLFAAVFVGAAVATLLLFRGAAWAAARSIRLFGRPRRPRLRLALANLLRPGNAAAIVVTSLGLGLTVLVAVAEVEGNFALRIGETIPRDAPAFFFVDIQPDQLGPLGATVRALPGAGAFEHVAMLRGRIVTINGVDAAKAVVDPAHAWVLRGDRGVTYAATPPEGAKLLSGAWWPPDYAGPPLVSIYQEIAEAFGIGVGDQIGINILGRTITAEVASVRAINFLAMTINFTLIVSPGVLERAPQTFLATLRVAPGGEAAVQRAVTAGFGNVTVIRVKEALDTVNALAGRIANAVRATAALALLAGTLVLAGAVAAGHRRRVYDAVVLKVLGATRTDLAATYAIEYGAIGLITAVLAIALGTLASWAVLTQVMAWPWVFLPWSALASAVPCTLVTLVAGLAGTWRALGEPAAAWLRNE
ncbi:MAG: FtsX-like permease family protein [Azospirillum sp.]|nr:FtsX-like permease family protein [Azospirillum sp.]